MLEDMVKAIINKDIPLVSNLSNVSAILNRMDNINWCGFYIRDDNHLYLGPFQGDVACEIIENGKGVCGTCMMKKETIIVPNVLEFDGHIACSSLSRSEICVPIIKNNEFKALIDIDAPIFDRFHNNEKEELEKIADLLKELF